MNFDLHDHRKNLKGIVLSEKSQSQRVKIYGSTCMTFSKRQKTVGMQNASVVARGWGVGSGTRNEFLGVVTLFWILSVVVVTRIHACVKIHRTAHSPKINFKKDCYRGRESTVKHKDQHLTKGAQLSFFVCDWWDGTSFCINLIFKILSYPRRIRGLRYV